MFIRLDVDIYCAICSNPKDIDDNLTSRILGIAEPYVNMFVREIKPANERETEKERVLKLVKQATRSQIALMYPNVDQAIIEEQAKNKDQH